MVAAHQLTAPTTAALDVKMGPLLKQGKLHGVDVVNPPGHVYVLSAREKAEVDAAMSHFKRLGLDGNEISPRTFPLPNLGKVLGALAADLHDARGFFILRGLSPAGLTPEDTVLRYLGISSFLADKIGVQDEYGNVFAHIREAKQSLEHQEDRPIRDSTLASHFHTDEACNILAMHTSGRAAEGGDHLVASSAAVYDVLCQTRPDVIPTLAAPIWHFNTRGRLALNQPRPLLYHHHNRIIFNFNHQALHGIPNNTHPLNPLSPAPAPTPTTTHTLSPRQLAALSALETAARQVHVRLHTHLGDMLYLHNFGMLHAREAFRDGPAGTQQRHLVRLWLKNSRLAEGEGEGLPAPLDELNARLFDDDPLVVKRRRWNVLPEARVVFTVAERLGP